MIFRWNNGCAALGIISLFVSSFEIEAQTFNGFAWDSIAPFQQTGIPFTVTLGCVDGQNSPTTNFNGTAFLTGIQKRSPTVLITEVDTGTIDKIEFSNLGEESKDIGQWQISVYDGSSYPQPKSTFNIPSNTVCYPHTTFQLNSSGTYPGTFPTFQTGVSLGWSTVSSPVVVLLQDQNGRLIDFFCAATGFREPINNPIPIPLSEWTGLPVGNNGDTSKTYQRVGNIDRNSSNDWVISSSSVSIINAGLQLPYDGGYAKVSVTPDILEITNGKWIGDVTITSGGSNLFLRADDSRGKTGDSSGFSVLSGYPIVLNLPNQSYEAAAGNFGPGKVSIVQPIGSDLSIALSSSKPDEIAVPSSVTILSGNTNAFFNLTNFDDDLLDGTQMVEITAAATNYATTTAVLKNIDNESTTLTVELPAFVQENAGNLVNTGRVVVSNPTSSDIHISLSSSRTNELRVPESILLMAGQTSASFSVLLIDDSTLNHSRTATVTALVSGWISGQAQTTILDNESTNLTMTVSSNLKEGDGVVTNAGTLKLSAPPVTNVAVSLISGNPSKLQIPSTVFFSPGQTSVTFNVTLPEDALTDGSQSVQITASSPGLKTAQVTAVVRDNDLHHFALSAIPSPQAIDRPFVITVNATDINGSTIGNFNGSAYLRGVSSAGPIVELGTNFIQFTNGTWSGVVAIHSKSQAVTLITEDLSSHAGFSNPFEVYGRAISLPSSDIVYDPFSKKVFAGALNSFGTNGQSVVPIDPYTGQVSNPIFIQNEPGRMAVSDNGQYLYVGLMTTGGVARINLASGLVDLRFALGSNVWGSFLVEDIEVLPGHPSTTVVATRTGRLNGDEGIAIFDNGLMRPNRIASDPSGYFLEKASNDLSMFASTPNTLRRLTVNGTGLSIAQEVSIASGELRFSTNRLFGTSGNVFDSTTLQNIGTVAAGNLIEAVADEGRVYVVTANGTGWNMLIVDMNTLANIGYWKLPFITGTPNAIRYCGSNTLAISTSSELIFLDTIQFPAADIAVSQLIAPITPSLNSNLVYSITVSNKGPNNAETVILTNKLITGLDFISAASSQGSSTYQNNLVTTTLGLMTNGGSATVTLVLSPRLSGVAVNALGANSNLVDPNPTNNSLTQTIVTPPPPQTNAICVLNLPARDLIYDPVTARIYASVPETGGSYANSLTEIDPVNLTVGASHPIGKNPGKMAIVEGGRYIYSAIDGESSIRLFDTLTGTASPPFSIGTNQQVLDMEVQTGTTNTLLVSKFPIGGWYGYTGVIYDSGIPRPNPLDFVGQIELSGDSSRVYSVLASQYGRGYLTLAVTPSGLVITNQADWGNINASDFKSDNGLVYLGAGGSVVNPVTGEFLQNYPGTSFDTLVRPDSNISKVFHLTHPASWVLQEHDLSSRALLKATELPDLLGDPANLIRWSTNGLAFCTKDGSGGRSSKDQIYIIRFPELPLLPTAELAISQTLSPTNGLVGSNVVYTIIVTNHGPDTATNMVITDTLPRDATFVSATVPQGGYTNINNIVTLTAGALTNGGIYFATVTVVPNMAGFNTNLITVSAGQNDYFLTNNTSILVHTCLLPSSASLISQLSLQLNDITYDSVSDEIYGSTQSSGPFSNSLVAINWRTGEIRSIINFSNEPARLAVSDNGQFIYAALSSTGLVNRVVVQNSSIDLSISTGNDGQFGPFLVTDMAVMPGHFESIAIASHTAFGGYNPKLEVYDNNIRRPNAIETVSGGSYFYVAFSPNPTNLYAVSPFGFQNYNLTESGLQAFGSQLTGFEGDFVLDGNLIFTPNGKVLDPQNRLLIATFAVNGLVTANSQSAEDYFLQQTGNAFTGPLLTLRTFSLITSNESWALQFPSGLGAATKMIKMGTNGIAFCTDAGRLVIVATPQLIPASADLAVTMTASVSSVSLGGVVSYSIKTQNKGPWTAANVMVTNTLPPGVSFNSATSTQGTCSQSNRVVVCSAGNLTNGASVTMTISVTATNLGTYTNSALAAHSTLDLVSSNDVATVITVVNPAPSISVRDTAVLEGNGPGSLFVPVILSAPSSQTVTVRYDLTNGTALGGQDYRTNGGLSGTLSFPPGSTNINIFVSGGLIGNTLVQSNRYFLVNLSNPTNAVIAKAQGIGWIIEDDFYQISANPISVNEGNLGFQDAVFSIRISQSNTQPVSVDFETIQGTASSGNDYIPKAGTISFPVGVTNQSLIISIKGDTLLEDDEQFTLRLMSPVGATLSNNVATAIILNDDAILPLSIKAAEYETGSFALWFDSIEGRTYRIQRSESLLTDSWFTISEIKGNGTTSEISYVVPSESTNGFFRVILLP